jgi:hypothetical protein
VPLRFTALLLLLVPAFMLTACGGSSEETKVEEAIETSATTTDPADCKKLETQNFIEQTSQESGQAALEECEKEAEKEEGAESVDVANVEVNGSSATAEAALTGGTLDGQTVEVELVKEGDQWKLNEVIKFTAFDKDKLIETFKQELSKTSNEVAPKFAKCFVGELEERDQGEMEELMFGGDSATFQELAEACA